jgi:two-component system phosphate regulon response regulator PhoB
MPTILIVDDDKDTAAAVALMLEGAGMNSACVHSGEEALAFFDGARADLAIVDWMMAGMDGIGLVSRLRARPDTREMPIVLFTAALNAGVRERALSAGATDCWVKSKLDLKEIERRVAEWVPSQRPRPAPFDRPLV